MPTYRSITISLVSQFDLMVIPEYPPPPPPPPPPAPRQDAVSTLPTLINEELSLISVFIPTYSGSQFWISYSIAPPNPPKALYYFKLFLNGACVVSWGCGKEDEYRGKTMFGLYESEANRQGGETGIQKRILCFRDGSEGSDDDILEIKVYRCRGRRPHSPHLEIYRGNNAGNGGKVKKESEGNVSLVNVGNLEEGHPQNFYQYALIDPIDKPFASFRYYYRPWAQLQSLGVVSPSSSCSSSIFNEDDEKTQHAPEKCTHMSAFISSSDESSPRQSLSDYLGHLRPLISRGSGSPPPAPTPSPSPSHPPPPAAPLHPSSPSPGAAINSPSEPSPPEQMEVTSSNSNSPPPPTAASSSSSSSSSTSQVRYSPIPATEGGAPLQPRQPHPLPRIASLGMLRGVVTRAVRRREKASNEETAGRVGVGGGGGVAAVAAAEGQSVVVEEEEGPKNPCPNRSDDVKKRPRPRPNIPLRTSSNFA